jgi:hypothetical protein
MEKNNQTITTVPVDKLKVIEDKSFNVGNKCMDIWEKTGDNNTLRMAVSTFRTSMQAIRDQSRYKSNK